MLQFIENIVFKFCSMPPVDPVDALADDPPAGTSAASEDKENTPPGGRATPTQDERPLSSQDSLPCSVCTHSILNFF